MVRKGFMAEGVSGQTLRLKASSKVLPTVHPAPPSCTKGKTFAMPIPLPIGKSHDPFEPLPQLNIKLGRQTGFTPGTGKYQGRADDEYA